MAMSGGQSCGSCNRGHSKGKANCPAAGSVCRKCNKRGHFAVVCRSTASVKLLNEVQQDWQSDQDEEEYHVGGIHDQGSDQGWYIKLKIGSQDLTWCIDTGAQVTVMPASLFRPAFG
ncbi:hypothetical protein ACOMHN_016727 [Nucella lapillus]